VSAIPVAAREILRDGTLCYLAAPSPVGPHVTPVVFVLEGDRVWGTTGRGTTKTRRWRERPVAGGLVRLGDRAVSFRGPVTLYDALNPATWAVSVVRSPQLALASTLFTVKNARFFAGYARDAYRVPLGWTPPGRVIFSVDLEDGAVLEREGVSARWGTWGSQVKGNPELRSDVGGVPPGDIPEDLRGLLEGSGDGTLGVDDARGPVVLPVRWARSGGTYDMVLPRPVLALAAPDPHGPGALVVDQASAWRAAKMRGLLLRGEGTVYVPDGLRSATEEFRSRLAPAGELPEDPAVVRLLPKTVAWWRGWSSGTVGRR
jgi:hypothetical protein